MVHPTLIALLNMLAALIREVLGFRRKRRDNRAAPHVQKMETALEMMPVEK